MRDRIAAALKHAMKSRDATRLSTLRLMSAALKDREIAAREDRSQTHDAQAEAFEVLSRMVRQRQESLKAYEEAGRLELAAREQSEIEVIREFLPRALSAAAAEQAVADAIRDAGAASLRDIGDVMALLRERHRGRMDFAAASAQVKAALG